MATSTTPSGQGAPPDALVAALATGQSPEALAAERSCTGEDVRALAAQWVAALDPTGFASVQPEWRSMLVDYLLGLQSAEDASMSSAHLGRFEPAALWAAGVRDQLRRRVPGYTGPPLPGQQPDRAAPESSPVDAQLEALVGKPMLAVGTEIADAGPDSDHFVVVTPAADRYFRVKAPQCAFLRSLDGTRTISELEQAFAGRLPDGVVQPLLAHFAKSGLLELPTSEPDEEPAAKRLRIRNLTAIQFCLADPEKLLARMAPAFRFLFSMPVRVASAAVIVIGLATAGARADVAAVTTDFLANPWWTTTLVLAMVATAMVHEFAHAAAVTYYGGRVRRMGVMLFYVAPALFCDTSDAWRFTRRSQRAVVAASGVWVQAVLAATATLALWLELPAPVAAWITCYATVNFGLCVVNLLPFVKLDGYWMLASLTDIPNLRPRSVAYLGRVAGRLLTGVDRPQVKPPAHPAACIAFALLAVAFPVILVASVLLNYHTLFLQGGAVGAGVWLALVALVLLTAAFKLGRLIARATKLPPAARGRAAGLGAAAAVLIALAAANTTLTITAPTSFQIHDGAVIVEQGPRGAVPGATVTLENPSILQSEPLAVGVLGEPGALGYPVVLEEPGAPLPARGAATVEAGRASLPVWLHQTRLRPALSSLGLSR